jgi:hypothetical protein
MEVKMEENTNIIGNETVETQQEEVKTYTQEEVMALLQSETDKRVQQALNTQNLTDPPKMVYRSTIFGTLFEEKNKVGSIFKVDNAKEYWQLIIKKKTKES